MSSVRNGLDEGYSQASASCTGLLRLQKTIRADRRARWNNQERPA